MWQTKILFRDLAFKYIFFYISTKRQRASTTEVTGPCSSAEPWTKIFGENQSVRKNLQKTVFESEPTESRSDIQDWIIVLSGALLSSESCYCWCKLTLHEIRSKPHGNQKGLVNEISLWSEYMWFLPPIACSFAREAETSKINKSFSTDIKNEFFDR